MRIHTRHDVSSVADQEHGTFSREKDGTFLVPDALGEKLLNVHINGLPAWETDAQQYARLNSEELSRRRDPANLFDAVEALQKAQVTQLTAAELRAAADALDAEEADAKPKKTPAKKTAE
jgi:hypothetical protein